MGDCLSLARGAAQPKPKALRITSRSRITITVRFVKLCESGGESPLSLGG